MLRLALNGSPRGQNSNSRLILSWIFAGLQEAGEAVPDVLALANLNERESQRRAFLAADEVLLVFPLYTDSVPGILKHFIDSLAGVDSRQLQGKRFCFVVHSGFPESVHSEAVTAYLKRLCTRLGMTFVGSAIKGGSEGFRLMPEAWTRNIRRRFVALGRSLARDGRFDPEVVAGLARPRRYGRGARILYSVLTLLGVSNWYWKMQLKKHGAWERRFDRPYERSA